jgi:hypothetical protein
MKKRGHKQSLGKPPGIAQWSILDALESDPRLLAERLRKGVASPEEMALAAELIQRRVKPRRVKKGQPKQIENQGIAQMVLVMEAGSPPRQRKTIISDVAKAFGVSKRHVYNALAEFGDTLLQTKENRDANERAFQQWAQEIARK